MSDQHPQPAGEAESSITELRILPDGKILVHNLTTTVASLLTELDPDDTPMRLRARSEDANASARNDPEHQS